MSNELSSLLNDLPVDLDAQLFAAIKQQKPQAVKNCIDKGANINSRNEIGNTPLHAAVEVNNPDIIEILVQSPNILNQLNILKKTPLQLARALGHTLCIELLQIYDPTLPLLNFLQHDFFQAIFYKNIVKVKNLIHVVGLEINEIKLEGKAPLHWAVMSGNIEIIELLLSNGADVDIEDNNYNTPLHWAVKKNDLAIAEILIKNNAKLRVFEVNEWTPLHGAVTLNNYNFVEWLITKGAEINDKTNLGLTPLHFAVMFKHIELVRLILNKAADINVRDNQGSTALHFAAAKINSGLNILLKNPKLNVNAKNFRGSTALNIAIKAGRIDNVEMLIKHGAEINLPNNDEESTLELLLKHSETIKRTNIKNAVKQACYQKFAQDIGDKPSNYIQQTAIATLTNNLAKIQFTLDQQAVTAAVKQYHANIEQSQSNETLVAVEQSEEEEQVITVTLANDKLQSDTNFDMI